MTRDGCLHSHHAFHRDLEMITEAIAWQRHGAEFDSLTAEQQLQVFRDAVDEFLERMCSTCNDLLMAG